MKSLAGGTLLILLPLIAPRPITAQASASPLAANSSAPAGDSAIGAAKMRAVPFHGIIASLDERARTFTIAGKENARSFKITETTVITKGEQAATMKDIVTKEEVRGSYYKKPDGALEAKTVKLGPLSEAEKAEKAARKEKREAKNAAASTSATP